MTRVWLSSELLWPPPSQLCAWEVATGSIYGCSGTLAEQYQGRTSFQRWFQCRNRCLGWSFISLGHDLESWLASTLHTPSIYLSVSLSVKIALFCVSKICYWLETVVCDNCNYGIMFLSIRHSVVFAVALLLMLFTEHVRPHVCWCVCVAHCWLWKDTDELMLFYWTGLMSE